MRWALGCSRGLQLNLLLLDKNNPNVDQAMMGRFRRLINDLELKEVGLTWSNERSAPTLVRLDRVFCSLEWEAMYPNCLLQSTAAGISDHCPLLLGLNSYQPGKRRFHFEVFWPQLPGFHETVQQAWNEPTGRTNAGPLEQLTDKFQHLTRCMQAWSQRQIGNVRSQLDQATETPSSPGDLARYQRINNGGREAKATPQTSLSCFGLLPMHHNTHQSQGGLTKRGRHQYLIKNLPPHKAPGRPFLQGMMGHDQGRYHASNWCATWGSQQAATPPKLSVSGPNPQEGTRSCYRRLPTNQSCP